MRSCVTFGASECAEFTRQCLHVAERARGLKILRNRIEPAAAKKETKQNDKKGRRCMLHRGGGENKGSEKTRENTQHTGRSDNRCIVRASACNTGAVYLSCWNRYARPIIFSAQCPGPAEKR